MSLRLRDARTTAGLTRKQLADLAGLSERTVNYYEDKNYRRSRKPSFVRLWAEACDREFEEVWGTTEHPVLRTGWTRVSPGSKAA